MIAGFEQPSERRDPHRGSRRRRAAAPQAPDQHGLPELRALPPPQRRGQRRLRPRSASACRRGRYASGSPPSWSGSASRRGEAAPGAALRRQQQRVALARALVNLPKVLLLDEPLGALDLKLRKGLQIELKRIQREVGITFVYVTHDQEEALTMSDRIAVMNRGRVEQVGRARGGLRAPRDDLRRRLHRRLQPDAGDGRRARARCGSTRARRVSAQTDGLGAGRALPRGGAAGEAPDRRTRRRRAAPANGLPRVEGIVESSVYLGTATQIVVDLGEGVRMTVLCPNAERGGAPAAAGRRRPGGAELGARAHARGARVAAPSPDFETAGSGARSATSDWKQPREGE